MTSPEQQFQLAQINIARLIAPLNDPRIQEFVSELNPINSLAYQSPGFVWRLQSDTANATDLTFNDDPFVIVNMSVWESAEALRDFTYRSRHVEIFRKRQDWFEKSEAPSYCLWWIPAGSFPTVFEGKARLDHFRRQGATSHAFWFSRLFPPTPGES